MLFVFFNLKPFYAWVVSSWFFFLIWIFNSPPSSYHNPTSHSGKSHRVLIIRRDLRTAQLCAEISKVFIARVLFSQSHPFPILIDIFSLLYLTLESCDLCKTELQRFLVEFLDFICWCCGLFIAWFYLAPLFVGVVDYYVSLSHQSRIYVFFWMVA